MIRLHPQSAGAAILKADLRSEVRAVSDQREIQSLRLSGSLAVPASTLRGVVGGIGKKLSMAGMRINGFVMHNCG